MVFDAYILISYFRLLAISVNAQTLTCFCTCFQLTQMEPSWSYFNEKYFVEFPDEVLGY